MKRATLTTARVGTVSETSDAVSLAYRARVTCTVSHRSGDTDDTFIADLAVAINAELLA